MQSGSYDETTIKDFLARMIDGWNHGDSREFAAPFSEGADFIAFDGTHLKGRAQIADFHERRFGNELKGTRLDGGAKFVHFLGPAVALLHAWGTTTLPGQTNASSSRDSMQLFVVTKYDGEWRFEAMLNARRITLDQQHFLDQFVTLSAGEQRELKQRVSLMRH